MEDPADSSFAHHCYQRASQGATYRGRPRLDHPAQRDDVYDVGERTHR